MNDRYRVLFKLLKLSKSLSLFFVFAVILGTAGHLIATSIPVLAILGLFSYGQYLAFPVETIFILLIISALCRGLFSYGEQLCNHYIAFKLLADLRSTIFAKLIELAPSKLLKTKQGDLASIVTGDIELIEVFYAHTISPILIATLYSIILTTIISQFSIILGIVALISYLILGLVFPIFSSSKLTESGGEYRYRMGDLNSYYLDSLKGAFEIFQYRARENRKNCISKQTNFMEDINKKLRMIEGKNGSIILFIVVISSILFLLFATLLWGNYLLSPVDFTLSFVIYTSSFGPVLALSRLPNNLNQTIISGERVLKLLDEESIISENIEGEEIVERDINIENIFFKYGKDNIFENFSEKIQAGEVIGISGPSGVGKSTLLTLIMRFWDVDKGNIFIGSSNIRDVNTSNLRNNQGYMTQSTCLFSDTIRNNVRIGRICATDEEIVSACKKASIHEYITKLPKGYDTYVGEYGAFLSEGEKQRIELARAFLSNRKILLLDEPTGNLDSLNEDLILKSIRNNREDSTIVIVSHRESTLKFVDRLIKIGKK